MANTFKLDDIRAAAEAKYGSTIIDLGYEQIELVNPLRLPKARRDQLTALQDRLGEENADQEALLGEALRAVAKSPGQGERLVEVIGGDLAVLASVFDKYGMEVQAGEA